MTYEIIYSPKAEQDLVSTYLYYEEQTLGLGDRFYDAFLVAEEKLSQNPFLYQTIEGELRRVLIKPFQVAVFFRARGSVVDILRILGTAQNPGLWPV